MANRLRFEKSPYLLQHQDNPVDWYPWGEEAFEVARREDKPVFLSVGYSTCYWCHMMEKDSFEHEEVATLINQHFVPVKVDREERPDVDKIYMDVVMGMTGRGGWPMSVFMTPEGQAFYGGTFFWKEQFKTLLTKLSDAWKSNRDSIDETAQKVLAFLEQRAHSSDESVALHEDIFRKTFAEAEKSFDLQFGGFGQAPKFPPSIRLQLLMRIHHRTGNQHALEMVTKTLDCMARGGLYDHLGGGFHRYATDQAWLVPHFEKMLYDNALLSTTYLEAYQLTNNDFYRTVAEETLDYVLRDMTHGAFFSAEDAGEVEKEGEYYVWSYQELQETLSPEEFDYLKKAYGLSKTGNFENQTTILHQTDDTRISAELKNKLLNKRSERSRPHRDDKILSAWNGLMIHAFARGYLVTNNKQYLVAAINAATFIRENMLQDSTLLRRFCNGDARYNGFLEDYAFFIQGLISLYEVSGELSWLALAEKLQTKLDRDFWDNEQYGYFFTESSSLIVRQKDFADGAIPSGNAVSALNLLKLYELTHQRNYKQKAEQIFQAASSQMMQIPAGYPSLAIAFDYFNDCSKELIVVGGDESHLDLSDTFLPNITLSFGKTASTKGKEAIDNKTTFYVCEEGNCQLPTNNAEEAKKLLNTPLQYEL